MESNENNDGLENGRVRKGAGHVDPFNPRQVAVAPRATYIRESNSTLNINYSQNHPLKRTRAELDIDNDRTSQKRMRLESNEDDCMTVKYFNG